MSDRDNANIIQIPEVKNLLLRIMKRFFLPKMIALIFSLWLLINLGFPFVHNILYVKIKGPIPLYYDITHDQSSAELKKYLLEHYSVAQPLKVVLSDLLKSGASCKPTKDVHKDICYYDVLLPFSGKTQYYISIYSQDGNVISYDVQLTQFAP